MVGTNAFGDTGCGKFVAAAYGVPGIGYHTAKQFRDALANQGRIRMSGAAPKPLVFSQSSWDGGGGHNVQVLPNWNPARGAEYLGWAVAPW